MVLVRAYAPRASWLLYLYYRCAFSVERDRVSSCFDRYRLPFVPPLLIFAAIGVQTEAGPPALRERHIPRAAAIIGATALLALFFTANLYHIDEKRGIAQIVYRLESSKTRAATTRTPFAQYSRSAALEAEYDRAAHESRRGSRAPWAIARRRWSISSPPSN
jgi:hypothetical protein